MKWKRKNLGKIEKSERSELFSIFPRFFLFHFIGHPSSFFQVRSSLSSLVLPFPFYCPPCLKPQPSLSPILQAHASLSSPCLKPMPQAQPILKPMPQARASSPAHPQAHASSPCQAPASSPCLKPIPLFPSHLSPPCLKSSRPYFPFFALILRYLFHLISLY